MTTRRKPKSHYVVDQESLLYTTNSHVAATKHRGRRNPFLFAIVMVGTTVLALHALSTTNKGEPQPKRKTTIERPTVKGVPLGPGGQKDEGCSCFTSSSASSDQCCNRKILRAHKMGVVLIQELFQGIESEIIDPSEVETIESADYRHVVVTRPWYDSIISGYLYHKSGRECWLDQNGNPRFKNKTFDWESNLLYPPSPPSRNRTLCQYLAEESEEDGMRAYVDFSLSDLYKGLLPHYELVTKTDRQRTLFVCFADLEDNKTATYLEIMNFLYPGGHSFTKLPNGARENDGSHGTSRDEELRQRLRSIIENVDRENFQGMGAQGTRLFGCERKTKSVQ